MIKIKSERRKELRTVFGYRANADTGTGPDQPALMSAVSAFTRRQQGEAWAARAVEVKGGVSGLWILRVCTHLTADETPHPGTEEERVGVSKGPGDTFSSKLNS